MKKLLGLALTSLFVLPVLTGCNTTKTYSITITQGENGTITASKLEDIEAGETIVLTNTPDDGYKFLHYLLNGEEYTENSFKMPSNNVDLSAAFDVGYFNITCAYNETIYFDVSENSVIYGEEVVIDYMPVSNYVLDKFYVNGEAIEGDRFIMPYEDVEITATTKLAYVESPNCVEIIIDGREQFNTRSNWFFTYGETGINIKTIVWDHFIVDNPETVSDIGYRDNIEFTIAPLLNVDGYAIEQTYNILVSVDGSSWFRCAKEVDLFDNRTPEIGQFTKDVKICHYLDKEGFEGYIVDIYLDYSLWGVTKDTASFVICFSHRNTINYPYKTYWDFYKGLGCDSNIKINRFPLINKDGSLSANPYLEGVQ